MAALQVNGQWLPKIKVSASREKTTLPSHKQVYRLYHRDDQTAFADVIALADENLPAKLPRSMPTRWLPKRKSPYAISLPNRY